VPQAWGKLPLKFVPCQTSGDIVELQIRMTGLLLILVVMQISKTMRDDRIKSIQLAGRPYWPLQKIHRSNRWEKRGPAHQREERL